MTRSVDAESHSSSDLLTALLSGPVVRGMAIARRQLRFGDYVLALTPPRTARMPNGIECGLSASPGMQVTIGEGRLTIGGTEIRPGPPWNPVPVFDAIECLPPGPPPAATLPDAALGGYVAGLVLLHTMRTRAEQVALRSIPEAEPKSATLLRHAARGEVPEPIHDLLATRDASRLIAFSPTCVAWLRGLISAGLPLDLIGARVAASRY